MGLSNGRNRFWLVLLVMLCLLILPSFVNTSEEYHIDSSILTVYRDGLTHVTQLLMVNETVPSIVLPLVSASAENVMVVDENQTVLDYELDGRNLTVFSFGIQRVQVEYDTVVLTEKEAGVWTLILNNTYDLSVYLPEEASIVYLNALPTSIETVAGRVVLSLPPNDWEISYILPVVGPAMFRVTDLTVDPAAVEVGEEVTILVVVRNIGDVEGSYTVVLSVDQVPDASKTVTLPAGASTTVAFHVVKEEPGTYTVRIGELEGTFTASAPSSLPAPLLYLLPITAAIFIVAYLVLLRRKKITADKIIDEHPRLRQEDREVIQFLDAKGGKAFESEIRERFPDVPRTSLWRLIRRLERMGIVTIRKIGLQNLVELR